jgi:hypothetical protein
MARFYDYHVELELPDGYKAEWDAVSNMDAVAFQVLGMADHRGANASKDFTARLRIYGNQEGNVKKSLLRSRDIPINAGFNVRRDYLRPLILQVFKAIA